MTTHETSALSCPADVLDWIPWYPGPGLSEEQKGAVESHAAACVRCREELALLAGEASVDADELPAADAVYDRVLARIADHTEGRDAALLGGTPPSASSAREGRTGAPPRRTRANSRWREVAVAAMAAAVAGLAFGWISGRGVAEPVYFTAQAETLPATSGVALDVIFREDATSGEVWDALHALGAQVVSGPDASDVVRLQLPRESDPAAAARMLGAERGGVAVFAEPAPPGRGSPR
ncbi:MAG: hypothetical protein ACQGVK_08230 [Myxococcota bacterium]